MLANKIVLPTDKFKLEYVMKDQYQIIYLKGTVDEDTDFNALLKTDAPLRLNFSGITAINSCGIRSWVNFLKDLGNKEIVFEECPPLIVRQMNMVPSFLGKARVASVFAPYICENCEHEKTVLVQEAQFKGANPQIANTTPCENCQKGEMEFDGQPKQYFAFSK